MTGYSDPNSPMQPLRPPKKGWFARSWWWFLPLVIGGPILCCGGGVGLFFVTANSISGMVEDSQAYKEGVKLLEANPEVKQELGTPITVATGMDLVTGGGSANISQSGSSQSLDARIPVSGPNGSGHLVLVADSGANGVSFTTLRLDTDSGVSIDLMPGGAGGLPGLPGLPDVPHDHDGDGVPDH